MQKPGGSLHRASLLTVTQGVYAPVFIYLPISFRIWNKEASLRSLHETPKETILNTEFSTAPSIE
jgi:hypothetical protein